MRSSLRLAGVFAIALAAYLLFAGQISWTEGAAAVPVAAAITGLAAVQHLRQRFRLHVRPPWGALGRTTVALAADTGRVGAALVRALGRMEGGAVTRQPFRPGGDDPGDAGRRAAVTLLQSVAPNGFVLDVPPSLLPGADAGLLLHQLAPVPPKPGTEWPA